VHNDFRVGPWLVQPSLNTISQNGTSNRLEPKMIEVLVCLADEAGEVVPKERLLQAVWPGTFVSDDVLKRSISELRRVFGDDAHQSQIIETIAKKGYRLVPRVEPMNGAPVDKTRIPASRDETGKSVVSGRRLRLGIATGIAATVLALVLLGFVATDLWRKYAGKGNVPQIRSIAVLPLKNLSGDPEQKYFAEGMTEELITDLSQISEMKVISRTSSQVYEDSHKSLPQIARELNVQGIVVGSVERSGDRVRITAQLVYGPEDRNLWAQSYERDLRDVLTLQNTVASAIADEIQVKMTPKEEARLHSPKFFGDLAAHEAYLRGSYYLNEPRGCAQAVEFFQQAILREPNTRAYVGLARAYECLSGIDETPREVLPNAEAPARKALALDEDLSDAHLLLGKTKFQLDWDWPGAEKEFRRAIQLNPNSAGAHLGYAWFLDSMGRMEEAERERLRAQEVDPLNELMNEIFYHTRQYQNAIEVLRKCVELNPDDMGTHWQLGILYDQTGMREEAIGEWERMFVLSGYEEQFGFAEDLKRGYLISGRRGALNRLLNNLERVSRQRHVPPDVMAYLYESLGDKESAFVWLQKAYDEHNHEIVGLKTDLMWDGLRSDPRFEDLVRRVGLPQ